MKQWAWGLLVYLAAHITIFLWRRKKMEKDIQLGTEGDLKVKVEGGMLILEISHKHASGELSLVAKEDIGYFLDKVSAQIPGSVDDMVFAVVKTTLKGL
jgi:hypothetical protein